MAITEPNSASQWCWLRVFSVVLHFAALALLTACGQAPSQPVSETDKRDSTPQRSSEIETPADLLARLQKNFDLATLEVSGTWTRLENMPAVNSAGIVCQPVHVSGKNSTFRIELPRNVSEREGTFAVIDPDGSFSLIYSSYRPDLEIFDRVVRSRTIDWQNAKSAYNFDVYTRTFDASEPHDDLPSVLFQKAGIYQFALMNFATRGTDETLDRPFRVHAGCVIEWRP